MADVVPTRRLTLVSEGEVRGAARGFLSKILRSSMRKNRFKGRSDPAPRPHSWHSSKLAEEEGSEVKGSDPAPDTAAAAAPAWQHNHEDRSLPAGVSVQGPPGDPLTPSSSSTMDPSTETPPDPPDLKGTSVTENMFFQGPPPEGGPCRPGGDLDLQRCSRYLLQPLLQQQGSSAGWEGGDPCVGRPSMGGPSWQLTDRKKSQSPPPPAPPLRSESFTAAKVFPYSDGPVVGGPSKTPGRGGGGGDHQQRGDHHKPQRSTNNHHQQQQELRRSFNPPPPPPPHGHRDLLYPPGMARDHQAVPHHPHRLFSLSSNDVRLNTTHHHHYQHQQQSAFTCSTPPRHQRQCSDQSPFYQTRIISSSSSSSKAQSVASYYRSLQDLPVSSNISSNLSTNMSSSRKHQARNCNQSLDNGGGGYRYLFIPSKHPGQGPKAESWRGCGVGREPTTAPHWVFNNGHDRSFCSADKNGGGKMTTYRLPQPQTAVYYGDVRDSDAGQARTAYDQHQHTQTSSDPLHASVKGSSSSSCVDAGQKKGLDEERSSSDVRRHSSNQAPPPPGRLLPHQELWLPQEDHRICAQRTPFLHALTQERLRGADAPTPAPAPSPGVAPPPRRADARYATALRHDIREKRAQLQKSRSAATLSCSEEGEEEGEEDAWKSASCFSSSYKDHLKEAQARVLQATSFQRRDLDPAGAETSSQSSSGGRSSSGQISRIGGRRRFPLAKRVHSFSEPDKIDKLGTTVEGEAKGTPRTGTTTATAVVPEDPQVLAEEEQQRRLGTFAEYQASWERQRKASDAKKTKGRFHSAENILDGDGEEKKKSVCCVHERSRSSPSADFYSQNIPWRDTEVESTAGQQNSDSGRVNSAQRLSPSPLPPGTPDRDPSSGGAQKSPLPVANSWTRHCDPTADTTPPSSSSQEFLLVTGGGQAEAEPHRSCSPVIVATPPPPRPQRDSSPLLPHHPHPTQTPPGGGGGNSGSGGGGTERRSTPLITMEPPTPPCIGSSSSSDSSPNPSSFPFLSFKTPEAPPPPLSVHTGSSSITDRGRSPPPLPLSTPTGSTSITDRGRSPPPLPLSVPSGSATDRGRSPPPPSLSVPSGSITDRGRSPPPPPLSVPSGSITDRGRSPPPPLPLSVPSGSITDRGRSPPLSVPSGSITDRGRSPPLSVPSGSITDRGRSPPPPPLSVPSGSATDRECSPPLSVPSSSFTDRGRSPSPHFAPHRLTDRPPPVDDTNTPTGRLDPDPGEVLAEVGSPVRKVPVKIVHSESSCRERAAGRAYLPPHHASAAPDAPTTAAPSENGGQRGATSHIIIASLGSTESATSPSPFSAYTRPQDCPPAIQGYRPLRDLVQSAYASALETSGSHRSQASTGNACVTTTYGTTLQQQQQCEEEDPRSELVDPCSPRGTPSSTELLEEQEENCRTSYCSLITSSTSPRTTEDHRREEGSLLVPSSSYYNTSAPKAELLIMMKDMMEMDHQEPSDEDEVDQDLSSTKMALMSSLSRKLSVLREARWSLQEEVENNEALGAAVEESVQRLCLPNQLERFRMFVGDLDKVVSLLLSLSGRLARVDNALNGLDEDGTQDEKRTLTEKRHLLMRQHDDARELKDNLDRREAAVTAVMETQLDPEALADYRHFVKMKAQLITEQRRLDDRIKLGEEQLACLLDSLSLEDRRRFCSENSTVISG